MATISVGELAEEAEVDRVTVEDYQRDSRKPSQAIVKALEHLKETTNERMGRAREFLMASYRTAYQTCRNPPGVQMPPMTATQIERFIRVSNFEPGQGVSEDSQETVSFGDWVKHFEVRAKGFYERPGTDGGGTILQGSAGGGKTTFIRLLLTKPGHLRDFTLAILPLPHLRNAGSARDILDSVVAYLKQKHWDETLPDLSGFLKREAEQKRLIYIFDGFDEISYSIRIKLLERLRGWETPYLLAGRPTLPRVDEGLPSAQPSHISKLSRATIAEFIDFRADQLTQNGQQNAAVLFSQLAKRVREGAGRIDRDEVFFDLSEAPKDHFLKHFRRDQEVLGLFASPATLNIVLEFIKDRKVMAIPSIEYLLDMYVDFLSDRWRSIRRLDDGEEVAEMEEIDRVGFIRVLGATAWLALFVHSNEPELKVSVIEKRVAGLLKLNGIDNPHAHFRKALQLGVDAQLLDREAHRQGKIHFSVSHDLMLSYFAGNFIHLATLTLMSLRGATFTIASDEIEACKWLTMADFKEMVNRPTLGVQRDAIFFYLSHLFLSKNIPSLFAENAVRELIRIPRIPEKDAGQSLETINEILPGNLIVAWRTLISNEIKGAVEKRSRLSRESKVLEERLVETYRKTNFEYVFEAIFRSCRERLIEKNLGADQEEGWRFCTTFESLQNWMTKVNCLDDVEAYLLKSKSLKRRQQVWQLRRCIYIMRYYTGEISNEMIGLLKKVDGWRDSCVKEPPGIMTDALMLGAYARGTARFISQGIPAKDTVRIAPLEERGAMSLSKKNLEWLEFVEADASVLQGEIGQLIRELSAESNPEAFVDLLVKGQKGACAVDTFANSIFGREDKWYGDIADICSTKLNSLQSNPEKGQDEVKLLNLIMCLSNSHYHRMFFLPTRYSLRELGLTEPPREFCDKNDCQSLKTLFRGAAKGIGQGADEANERPGGDFQVYDYYVRALWRLLQEHPITMVGL